MNLSFIRKISHFARCGFFEKLVSPEIFQKIMMKKRL
ncbi:hypothetical protein cmbei_3003136, partial [Cryptosporidium meleagridis]